MKQIVTDSLPYVLKERVPYINLMLKSIGSYPRYSYVLTYCSACIFLQIRAQISATNRRLYFEWLAGFHGSEHGVFYSRVHSFLHVNVGATVLLRAV